MASVNKENIYRIGAANNRLELSGMKFSSLLVISFAGIKKHPCGSSHSLWNCKCDCGKEIIVHGSSLTTGNSKSCGCVSRRNTSNRCRTHGMSGTNSYLRWQGMMNRCRNIKDISYKNYGGRGITVCERWTNYSNFISDMGQAPEGCSLDRIDNNGNYEPGNCKWSTVSEQSRNKRSNRIISFQGKSQALIDWAREIGIDQASLRERLDKWSIQDSLTKPKREYGKS